MSPASDGDQNLRDHLQGVAPVRLDVMGVGFDVLTEGQFVARIVETLTAGTGGYAVTPNTDIVRKAGLDGELAALLRGADLSVADGMPIIWASRLAGTPLPERVAGSSALFTISAAAAEAGAAIFLLGGRQGAGVEAAQRLRAACPGLRIAEHCPPMGFETDEVARAALDLAVADFGPAVYFCGFGCPKQERLISRLSMRYPASWFIACGGTIDFASGETNRAPLMVQRLGLEWVWRLVHEPQRLYRRYLLEDVPFAVGMLVQAVKARRRTLGRR